LSKKQAENFCNYLREHCHRIIDYSYFQENEICSIGSGAVESTIKQIEALRFMLCNERGL
ncbi:MAG: hypothetical protein INR81_25840, partial [Microcystis aeruginosa PMC 728.11]|nr:hypothetical protein [Microcystis aeruginosa PMC 728.11]